MFNVSSMSVTTYYYLHRTTIVLFMSFTCRYAVNLNCSPNTNFGLN